MRTAILYVLLVLVCAAEISVTPPSIGAIRDCEGRVRRVLGAPGAFLLGPPEPAPSAAPPAAPDKASVDGRTLILLNADRSEKRVRLPEPAAAIQQVASGWLAAPPFVIHLTADGAAVYRLPMKACGSRPAEVAR